MGSTSQVGKHTEKSATHRWHVEVFHMGRGRQHGFGEVQLETTRRRWNLSGRTFQQRLMMGSSGISNVF